MARRSIETEHETVADMYEAGDVEAILNRSAEEVQPPGLSPNGRWVLRCTGTFIRKFSQEDREENPDLPIAKVLFYHTPHEPLEGVDPDKVEGGEWRGKKIQTTRNIKEPGDDYKVLQLAALHGIDTSGRSLKQVLEACKGRFVEATVGNYTFTRNRGKPDAEEVKENQLSNFTTVGA